MELRKDASSYQIVPRQSVAWVDHVLKSMMKKVYVEGQIFLLIVSGIGVLVEEKQELDKYDGRQKNWNKLRWE